MIPIQPAVPDEPRDPSTPDEWQEAVNLSRFFLLIDAAKQYGLLEGGPGINKDRCISILERGASYGYRPCSDQGLINMYVPQLVDAAQIDSLKLNRKKIRRRPETDRKYGGNKAEAK